MAARGHRLVFLQAHRDLLEAGDDLGGVYTFDAGLPELDVLFLEWRWSILGRNTTPCGTPGHTCDLHRQEELLDHYTVKHATPTIILGQGPAVAGGRPVASPAGCEGLRGGPGAKSWRGTAAVSG
jgi:hypothetical protein